MAFKELLSTRDLAAAAVLESLLESEGIPYFIQGEQFSGAIPFGGEARFMVDEARIEEARDLAHALDSSSSESTPLEGDAASDL